MNEPIARRAETLRALRRASGLIKMHYWERSRTAAFQQQRLRAMVDYARHRSPWHAARLRGIDVGATELLRRLPVMTKTEMMRDLPAVLTDPRLREIDLDAHLGGVIDDALLLSRYRVMATGGTSGLRGLFVYDRAAWVDVVGVLAAGPRWFGMPPRLPRARLATIWASGPAHMTARLAASFDTPIYRRLQLSATQPIAGLTDQLNQFRPDWLSAYPSIAALIATEQLAGRVNIAPKVVLVSSEQCTTAMRDRIRQAWGIEPYDAYATTETATLGVECERHAGLHVFEGQVILEVVDSDGQPVPDGTPGAKIYITNLFNRVQPLLRYELTDLVTIAEGSCSCGRTSRRIAAIEGRSSDVMVLTDATGTGVPVHPNHFLEPIEEVAGVRAYQVTQHADHIDVALVVLPEVADRAAATAADLIRRHLAPLGVAGTDLRVRLVDEIPRPESAGGKFRLVRALPSGVDDNTIKRPTSAPIFRHRS